MVSSRNPCISQRILSGRAAWPTRFSTAPILFRHQPRQGLPCLFFSITSIPCCSSFALSGFFIFNLQNRLSKFPAFRKTRKSGVALSRRPVGFSISYLSGYILIVSPIFRFSFLRGGSDGVLWANKGRAAALIPPIGRRPSRNPGRAQRRRKIPGGRR